MTATVDPKTGQAVDRVPRLGASRGYEVGLRTEAPPGLQSSIVRWTLDSDSERVSLGDAGASEEGSANRRLGVERNNRWIPLPWLLIDADFAWTCAPYANGDRIQNAVHKGASIAIGFRELGPWIRSLQSRYLGSGALTEVNAVRSRPLLTTNLRLTYRVGPKAERTLDVSDRFDRTFDDIQYFYESRLRGEPAPVADRHVQPAEPRSAQLTL